MHEVDSACWRDWDLFHLPGGPSAFVALHLPLTLLVIWGYGQVLAGSRPGLWMSAAIASAGIFALGIHGAFLLAGRAEFRTFTSMAVLVTAGLVSIMQVVAIVSAWRRPLVSGPIG